VTAVTAVPAPTAPATLPRRTARRALGLLVAALATTLLAVLAAPAAQAQSLKLRVIGTTDLHMHLLSWDYYQDRAIVEYGFERTATLIEAARAEVRNSLLVDNGDLIQGSPLGDVVARVKPLAAGQVHPAIALLNRFGYDAAALGNHEFNYGLDFLRRAYADARFPVLSANVVEAAGPRRGQPAFQPHVLLERRVVDEAGAPHTLKVGVIGVVPPQILLWDRQHLQGRVEVLDILDTVRRTVPRLRAEGADVVVVLAHSGYGSDNPAPMSENATAAIAQVPGVDAIVFGHSHGEFPGPAFARHAGADVARGTIHGVPAAMAGSWGSHLAVIDLVLEREGGGAAARWVRRDGSAEIRPVADRAARRALVAPHAGVAETVRADHAATLAWVRAEVARTADPIHSFFAQVADDPSVQLVSQAQLAYARRLLAGTPHERLPLLSAAAPFKSGGRGGPANYTDIPAGPVAVRNVADLYIYPNTVQVVKLTGAQVREWLEMSAQAFNRIDPAGPPEQPLLNPGFPSYNFDTLDGVTYAIDVTQPARHDRSGRLVAPAARRIVDPRHEGRPLDDRAEFLVVTNNYRASGGGAFPGLDGSSIVLQAPDENREALLQYLQAQGTVRPAADRNWRLLPVPGVKLRFQSSARGIAHLASVPQVQLVRDEGNGFATYEIAP
jgi:2',3'-cyclic-nucleotide 2'-phosphodiesterase/3'-nucleotidase